jgi:hypothetical protein
MGCIRFQLENRLNEATAEESRQLLEEVLKASCLDKSEVAVVERRPSALSDVELEELTFKVHVTE